jgi:hypothetical protein
MAHADREDSFPLHAVASTVTGGAGFYSHLLGVAPYVFGSPPDEVYSIYHLPVSFYELHPVLPFNR